MKWCLRLGGTEGLPLLCSFASFCITFLRNKLRTKCKGRAFCSINIGEVFAAHSVVFFDTTFIGFFNHRLLLLAVCGIRKKDLVSPFFFTLLQTIQVLPVMLI